MQIFDMRSEYRYIMNMSLQELLNQKNITKYHLSKISGIPKTTIIDICNGKTSVNKCSAKTIYQIALALKCSMEDIMKLDDAKIDNEKYLECGLPQYLQQSVKNMKNSWKIIDNGDDDLHWDVCWCDLNASINSAEVDHVISSKQAWYLRNKYLRIKR